MIMIVGFFVVWIVCGVIEDIIVNDIGFVWFKDYGYMGGWVGFFNVIDRINL